MQSHGVRSEFCTADPSRHNVRTLRHLYELAGGYISEGVRPTTPAIFDTATDRIVSNDSKDIAKFLNAWGEQERTIGDSSVDLYPSVLRSEIDKTIEWIFGVNNGVYRCGFASSQPSYDEAAVELEARMVEVERHLGGKDRGSPRQFLVGEQLTIADIRLFNTLVRMDEVYVTYFKCQFASLCDASGDGRGSKFPNLLRFTAHLLNTFPEIRESVSMDDIRNHYFTSHPIRNSFAIVPKEVGVLPLLKKQRLQSSI